MYVSLFNLSGLDSEERRSVHSAETRENRTNMFWGICKGQKKKKEITFTFAVFMCCCCCSAPRLIWAEVRFYLSDNSGFAQCNASLMDPIVLFKDGSSCRMLREPWQESSSAYVSDGREFRRDHKAFDYPLLPLLFDARRNSGGARHQSVSSQAPVDHSVPAEAILRADQSLIRLWRCEVLHDVGEAKVSLA